MTAIILYTLSLSLLLLSYKKDRLKTRNALRKSWKAFEGVMPQFLGIILIVGLMLTIIRPEVIADILGEGSNIVGVISAALLGSIIMMPTFVAFPTADMLLKNGAGYAQVGALVSTLTMVGILTIPLEAKYIGKKAAIIRNSLSFLFSFLVALVIKEVFK
jgi:uncharacterized membrane protein YraQ (UPF0718 family)